MTRRWRSLGLASAAAVSCALTLLFTACDDAILGVRSLDCDGGGCLDAASPDSGDGGDSAACPSVVLPACDAGVPVAQRDGACVVAYACEVTCESRGGTCETLAACAGRRWSTDASSDCTADLGCCRSCPPIAAPPADFCDGGPIAEVREGDCVVDFACP